MNDVDRPLVDLLMCVSSCSCFHLASRDSTLVAPSDPASMRSIHSTADWYSLGMIFFRCSHGARSSLKRSVRVTSRQAISRSRKMCRSSFTGLYGRRLSRFMIACCRRCSARPAVSWLRNKRCSRLGIVAIVLSSPSVPIVPEVESRSSVRTSGCIYRLKNCPSTSTTVKTWSHVAKTISTVSTCSASNSNRYQAGCRTVEPVL